MEEDAIGIKFSNRGISATRGMVARLLATSDIRSIENPVTRAVKVYQKLRNTADHIGFTSLARVIPGVTEGQIRRGLKAIDQDRPVGRNGRSRYLESSEVCILKTEIISQASMNKLYTTGQLVELAADVQEYNRNKSVTRKSKVRRKIKSPNRSWIYNTVHGEGLHLVKSIGAEIERLKVTVGDVEYWYGLLGGLMEQHNYHTSFIFNMDETEVVDHTPEHTRRVVFPSK